LDRVSWVDAIRRFDRNICLLFIVGGLLGFTYSGISDLLTNLFVLRLGYGTEVVGNLNFLNYILLMAASIPAGAVGVRFGIRRAMIAGGALALLGWGLAPLSAFLSPARGMEILVASRILGAIGGALFLVNSNPALMGAAEPGSGIYAFAFNGTIVSLASFLGTISGGLLPQLFSSLTARSLSTSIPYGLSLWTAVVVLMPGLAALFFFRERSAGKEKGESLIVRFPLGLISLIALVRFLREMGYGGVSNFFNVYLDAGLGLPTTIIGVLKSVSLIAAVVFTPLMPVIARRVGTGRASLIGILLMAAGVVPIAVFSHWAAATAGWGGMAAANSINEAAMQVYILQIVAPRWRPLMAGAANMATTLGLGCSALAGGYLIRSAGYQRMFMMSAGFLLASGAVFAGHLAVMRLRSTRQEGIIGS
jgi:MFS family permease